jgi:hypothetical protein
MHLPECLRLSAFQHVHEDIEVRVPAAADTEHLVEVGKSAMREYQAHFVTFLPQFEANFRLVARSQRVTVPPNDIFSGISLYFSGGSISGRVESDAL